MKAFFAPEEADATREEHTIGLPKDSEWGRAVANIARVTFTAKAGEEDSAGGPAVASALYL